MDFVAICYVCATWLINFFQNRPLSNRVYYGFDIPKFAGVD
jgi:hypothetical protein